MCRLGESSNRIVSGRTQPARISFVRKERADKRRCRPLLAFAPTINFSNGREPHISFPKTPEPRFPARTLASVFRYSTGILCTASITNT